MFKIGSYVKAIEDMKIQGIDNISDLSDCEKLKKTRSSRKRKVFDETDNRIMKKSFIDVHYINNEANCMDEDSDSIESDHEGDNNSTSEEETNSDAMNNKSPASLNVIPSVTPRASINNELLNMVSSVRDGMEVIKGKN